MQTRFINMAMLIATGMLMLASCSKDKYDDSILWNKVNSIEGRVGTIETTLSGLNSDLAAISTVATAAEGILTVTSVRETAEGYVVTYSNGQTFNLNHGTDGRIPTIGSNGNWWIGGSDTGVNAKGSDGKKVYIRNLTWWVGDTDTGVAVLAATGSEGSTVNQDVPLLGIDLYTDGRYYWTQTVNGVKSWLLDKQGRMIPVTGNDAIRPIIRVNKEGYWTISLDGGITYEYIFDGNGQRVAISEDGCNCTTFFKSVRLTDNYLIVVLVDDTEVRIPLGGNTDIPRDPSTPSPDPGEPTVNIPNVQYVVEVDGNDVIVRLDMTGIQDPITGEWIKLFGTGYGNQQNVWVDIEYKPKGIVVYNMSDNDGQANVATDVVFTVDNSGSMGDEAEGVARDITSWAKLLNSSGLNVQFGCVGFGGNVGEEYGYLIDNYGVTGALNMGTLDNLDYFLNRRGNSGTGRTRGYYGSDASILQSRAAAPNYSRAGGECGVQAIRFADENFAFRNWANRIYVNFTDDANYTGGNTGISVDYFADQSTWGSYKGTVHSVISSSESTIRSRAASVSGAELPWLMSNYTGGTVLFVPSNFSGVSLSELPVTGAMRNSYVIRFTNVLEFLDGQPHLMRITILTPDGHVRAVRLYYITFIV